MTKLKLQGEEVDLTNALPLRVSDWRALEKRGISLDKFTSMVDDDGKVTVPPIEDMVQVVIRVLMRAGKDEAFVDNLSLSELTQVFSLMGSKEVDPKAVDRPT